MHKEIYGPFPCDIYGDFEKNEAETKTGSGELFTTQITKRTRNSLVKGLIWLWCTYAKNRLTQMN